MRSRDEINADPSATPEEIYTLSGMEQVLHPNCPIEEWWILAPRFAMSAVRSPIYELVLLDTPDRWVALEEARAVVWLNNYFSDLTERQQELLYADCMERLLPALATDCLPYVVDFYKQAILARREYAEGKIRGRKAKRTETLDRLERLRDDRRLSDWAKSVLWQFCRLKPDLYGIAWLLPRHEEPTMEGNVWYNQERLWQWRRMKAYFRGEA